MSSVDKQRSKGIKANTIGGLHSKSTTTIVRKWNRRKRTCTQVVKHCDSKEEDLLHISYSRPQNHTSVIYAKQPDATRWRNGNDWSWCWLACQDAAHAATVELGHWKPNSGLRQPDQSVSLHSCLVVLLYNRRQQPNKQRFIRIWSQLKY